MGTRVGDVALQNRHLQVRILPSQPRSPLILARRETLQKSPDIPCVTSRQLGLWRLLIPIFGSKSASFVGQSQFKIFQFPFLQRPADQRPVCSTLRLSSTIGSAARRGGEEKTAAARS